MECARRAICEPLWRRPSSTQVAPKQHPKRRPKLFPSSTQAVPKQYQSRAEAAPKQHPSSTRSV
eukprot:11222795-Lingulodinium_polyedra.AAC.1